MLETTVVKQMPETRRKILELLKTRGPQTADQLAAALSITSMGVRQHLVALERDGLIAHSAEQRGKGRPSHVYDLKPAGDELFPRSYAQMVNSFIAATRQALGQEGLDAVFNARNAELEARYQTRLAGKTLEEKVAELARIRSEEGYMADWERSDDGPLLLHERNCAICQVAKACLQVCNHELMLFCKVLPEAQVHRQSHLIDGDRTCTYVIQRKSD